MTEEYRLTSEQKYAILQEIMQQIKSKSGVMAVHSDDLVPGRADTDTIHTYQIAGSDVNRRTQTSNLQQKIATLQASSIKVEEAAKMEQEVEEQEPEKQGFRYYKSNVRCYRCKKIGHHNYACPDRMACLYCLSEKHPTERCPQKIVCYQCYCWGHVSSECPEHPAPLCQNCKRKHNGGCYFLTRGTEPIKQFFSKDYLAEDPNVRCIKCLKYGHLVCQN